MTEVDLTDLPPETRATLDSLALRYRNANSVGMQVLSFLGGQADSLLEKLPDGMRGPLDAATHQALLLANDAAWRSKSGLELAATGDRADWINRLATTAMGAAGGFGGIPTALAELPVTTTVLLRAIQGIAEEEGFDTGDPKIRMQAIQVFGAAGPMAKAQTADTAFLSVRLTLTGAPLQALIARVAPRLATVLGQKLAAQAVPVIGAAAGAATNYAFTKYYQDMAHVYFGLRALGRDTDVETETLINEFRLLVQPPQVVGAP